ncbi:MAG: CotH kinase family protein, partial [Bacteroidales bacterium]|nr:CotH kinase family protein [Bacteroidales bacterium]
FKDKPIMEFGSFIIRNSGNDWFGESSGEGTMFRDVLMTRLTKNMDLEVLASRQAVIYINGEYWGIQNIREKINEHYLASNKAVDPDQVELLEGNQAVIVGDNQHYASLINFINSNNIQNQANYDYVKTQMDVRNFINYQVAQIYYDNSDWPGNNIKYWRPATPNGKWRWIMYDTDFGFGLWNPNNVYNNTLLFATEPNGPSHPNPPWSTFLLRQLLTNEEFKYDFINTFADHINTSFNTDLVIDMINNLRDTIDEEMFHHVNRWGGSYQNWINQANDLRNFASLRPSNMLTYLRNTFKLGYKKILNLDVSDQKGGYIKLNSIYLHSFPWQGTYFEGVPVEITAIPNPGYRFTGWSGDMDSSSPEIIIDIKNLGSLTANFVSDAEMAGYPVVINEIAYKPDAYNNSDDWIELYNNSDYLTDISGWVLKDANDANSYFIKQGTVMAPHHYHVICRNLMNFETVYPLVTDYQGEMGFGLNNEGDMVRLFNHKMELVDSVAYGVSLPWPEIQNGSGYTLTLRDPSSDNTLPQSWFLSNDRLGTPGGNNAFALGNEGYMEGEITDVLFQNSPNPFTHYTRIIFYSAREQ